jgi:RNA polymerase sigma-70 factor (ECF subfamily)
MMCGSSKKDSQGVKMKSGPDSLVFEDVARDLSEPVLHYLERYVGDRALADDLRQETLLRVHQGLSAFGRKSSIKTWVFSIASRVAADYYRQPGRKARMVELDEERADIGLLTDERLVVDEMNACVRRVINSLPDAYREALVLHDMEGLSGEQTAEVLDCTVATAKIRIHRARLRLKQALENKCEFYRDSESILRCDRKT